MSNEGKIATGKDIHQILSTFPSSNKCPTLSYVRNNIHDVQNKSNRKENQCLIKDNISAQDGILTWDQDLCTMCGLCMDAYNDVCPTGALSINDKYQAVVIDSSKCIGCTMCYDITIGVCPANAYDTTDILIV